jgi:hypothetical protein
MSGEGAPAKKGALPFFPEITNPFSPTVIQYWYLLIQSFYLIDVPVLSILNTFYLNNLRISN